MADKRVVIVDDEQDNVDFMVELLESEGLTARGYTDSEQALEAMRQERPDVAVLDVQMPGLNGFQMLTAIREDPGLASVPVVLLSAIGAVTGEEYTPERIASKYGVRPDAFLTKPIDPAVVTPAIRELLAARED
jgi:CheY-like chemotaxis protein